MRIKSFEDMSDYDIETGVFEKRIICELVYLNGFGKPRYEDLNVDIIVPINNLPMYSQKNFMCDKINSIISKSYDCYFLK